MITKNQLLTALESELPRILGEIFKLYDEHDFNHVVSGNRICRACGIRYHDDLLGEICKIPLPIGITDWNEAMRFRDRAVEKHGTIKFTEALRTVWHKKTVAIDFRDWLLFKAQPVNYLIAAALLEIKEQ